MPRDSVRGKLSKLAAAWAESLANPLTVWHAADSATYTVRALRLTTPPPQGDTSRNTIPGVEARDSWIDRMPMAGVSEP